MEIVELEELYGWCYDNVKIENCTNNNTVYCKGTVTMSAYKNEKWSIAGGIAGGCKGNSTIENCYTNSEAIVYGHEDNVLVVGGIAGLVDTNSKVLKCYNKGKVGNIENPIPGHNLSGKTANVDEGVGGIVGLLHQATIDQCYNEGEVKIIFADSGYGGKALGGIVGYVEDSTISNVYNTGTIKGIESVGGIIGQTNAYYNYDNDLSKTYLNNAYNYSTNIFGNNYYDNLIGYAKYIVVDYAIWLSENEFSSSHALWDSTASSPHWQNNTTAELRSTTSNVLGFLKNGVGTKNSVSLWAQNSNKNDGLPYLVNVPL